MKTLLLLLTVLFTSLISLAQSPAGIASYNMTSTATSYSPTSPINRSLKVRFELQNDSLVLIDSFISDQPFVDSFLHTDLQADTVQVDYSFENAIQSGGSSSCMPNVNGINDSIYVYSFRLFHKDSFQNKTIFYKGNYYKQSNLGSPNWNYTPKEFDVDSMKIMTPYYGGNIDFYMNQACPVSLIIAGDSILLQVSVMSSSAPGHHLLKEDAYSTLDSFNLRLQVPCANLFTLDNRVFCYNIYVGDTATTNSLDIKMASLNSSHPGIGYSDYWFHYDNSGVSIYHPQLGTVPVQELTLNGKLKDNTAILNWFTRNEKNTSHFNIMRSYDGINFELIGTKQAAGNSEIKNDYSYEDIDLIKTNHVYYRVDVYDLDQKSKSSNVVKLTNTKSDKLQISPNPFTNSIFINELESGEYRITISTITGKIVRNDIIRVTDQTYEVITQSLPNGLYILQTQNLETQEHSTQKIIKQ